METDYGPALLFLRSAIYTNYKFSTQVQKQF